jgi:hypothetical protein
MAAFPDSMWKACTGLPLPLVDFRGLASPLAAFRGSMWQLSHAVRKEDVRK